MTRYTKNKKLVELLLECQPYLSNLWRSEHLMFFELWHLRHFAKALLHYYEHGVPTQRLLPHFDDEVTPNLEDSFSVFKSMLSTLDKSDFKNHSEHHKLVASTIESVPFSNILALMGQRQTSASITTSEGLPIASQKLIDSCFEPFNNQISVGVRAWEKHSDRSEEAFWGTITGTPIAKENHLKTIITQMIQSHTWWNTFHHYKHEVVYEIRVPSGHGIRWTHKELKLIGFLEPFL
jgi:hypothetical protein